jgi:tRNA(Ile)-lysidine synthase
MWLNNLRLTLETHIGKGATLIVAVSGGGDSVALLHGLHQCHEVLNLRLVVAHLDHALRPDSGADAAFVGNLALQLGWMCLRERVDVASWAATEGRNIEDAARQLRYTFLETAAKAVGASAIVVAHTQDDQAETLLMHLLRGAGLEGLAGMATYGPAPLKDGTTPLFRPLLTTNRATLRIWLTRQGHSWREDSTNTDTHRFRSHVRYQILPFLEESSPRLRERLAQTASLLSTDAILLRTLTNDAWERVATVSEGRVHFNLADFLAEPLAIQRRLIRRAYTTIQSAERELSAEHINRAMTLIATGNINQQATLPGGMVLTLAHDSVWLGAPFQQMVWEAHTLPDSGTIKSGYTFTLSDSTPADIPSDWQSLPPTIAYFDRSALNFPLTVRPPRSDDRWQPYGMNGQVVALREWLAKQKVPLHQRETVPLVVDAHGQIVWVVGWRTAHIGSITPRTTDILRIEATE